VAGLCAAVLLGLFVLETVTPPDRGLTPIALPLVAAAWLLSGWKLLSVAIVGLSVALLADWVEKIHLIATAVEAISLMTLTGVINLVSRGQNLTAPRRRRKPSMRHNAPTGTLGDPGLVTKRERDVVGLAAQGHSNREMGKRLFIGERTVETHLSNAYSKLGFASKVELVRHSSGVEDRAEET
jgi:DNA-binding CsgD family transcriptional regulator